MATRTKSETIIAGLTEEERAALLHDLEAERQSGEVTGLERDLTPRERVIGALMRERDHMDGCPVHGATRGTLKVEAYDAFVDAPGPPLRSIGARKGDTVTVTRCQECGGVRYYAGTVNANLARILGGTPAGEDDEPLDDTL